jgi:hypothetical protein
LTLGWGGNAVVSGVRLTDEKGATKASLKELRADFDIGAALQGRTRRDGGDRRSRRRGVAGGAGWGRPRRLREAVDAPAEKDGAALDLSTVDVGLKVVNTSIAWVAAPGVVTDSTACRSRAP